MSSAEQPAHDMIDDTELSSLHEINEAMMAANFQERLHVFRARVLARISFTGLDPTAGKAWHMYRTFEDQGAVLSDSYSDLALIVSTEQTNPNDLTTSVPVIRIIASERFRVEDGVEFLTKDVTVDADGDAQCYVGSYPSRTNMPKYGTTAPVCVLDDDGDLLVAHASQHTVIVPANCVSTSEEDEDKEPVLPFGHFAYDADKQYAFEMAVELFDRVEEDDPAAHGYYMYVHAEE